MYKFFYDESFHDRKITNKGDYLNIYFNNQSDDFVYCFTGFNNNALYEANSLIGKTLDEIDFDFAVLEGNHLKGTSIAKKGFRYGIASLNTINLKLYQKLFTVLYDSKAKIHIGVLSKTEYFLNQFISKWMEINSELVAEKLNKQILKFKYTFIKFMYNHKSHSILSKIISTQLNSLDRIKPEILDLLWEALNVKKHLKRTQNEARSIEWLYSILISFETKNETIKINPNWDYNSLFNGFNRYLLAEGITQKEVDIVIFSEKNTTNAAKNYGYHNVFNEDIKGNALLRISDFVSNLFGRLLYSLQEELKEPTIIKLQEIKTYDYESIRHINKNWFKLSEEQFGLYKLIDSYLKIEPINYWILNTEIYCDSISNLTALFHYIGYEFTDYEEFKRITPEDHKIRFTQLSYRKLMRHFRTFFW